MTLDLFEKPEDLGPPNSYDLTFESTKLKLPKEIVAAIDPTGWLKPAVDRLTVSGHAAFRDPIDRIALEEGRLALRAATIREAGFEWGDMRLVAKGAVRSGQPVKVLGQGEISVAVTVTANKFSSSARDKIDAAGGSTIEL